MLNILFWWVYLPLIVIISPIKDEWSWHFAHVYVIRLAKYGRSLDHATYRQDGEVLVSVITPRPLLPRSPLYKYTFVF